MPECGWAGTCGWCGKEGGGVPGEGGVACDGPSAAPTQPGLALRRGPLAPVPRVWGQQQREALWHLRLQRLQRLLQEECEAKAYLQVRDGAPHHRGAPPATECSWEGGNGGCSGEKGCGQSV